MSNVTSRHSLAPLTSWDPEPDSRAPLTGWQQALVWLIVGLVCVIGWHVLAVVSGGAL